MLNKLMNRYYLTTFISEVARTIPHPILTILLIDQKHLSLSQIIFIQIFFYIGVLLFEIPSGYLADRGYRKSSYIASFLCLLIAYSLIYVSSSLVVLGVAWFIYGIAIALMSGNVDGYIVNRLKDEGAEDKIKQFNIRKTNTSLSAGIIGAVLGSVLYPFITINIYALSICLYLLAIVIALFGIRVEHQPERVLASKAKKLEFTPAIKTILILVCLIELYYIGFYQTWQVLYQAKGIPVASFGLIYIIFSLTVITSNKFYGRIEGVDDRIALSVFVIVAVLSVNYLNSVMFVLIYPLTLFIANLYVIDLYTNLYKHVDELSISRMISIVSSANRVFGIVILGAVSVLLNHFELNLILIALYVAFACSFLFIRRLK